MAKMIFVNLPVVDVAKATAFYEAIGATKNPTFSSPDTSCMILSDTIHVMLMEHARFESFSPKPIADRTKAEVLLCISHDNRAEVDAITEAAVTAGGIGDPSPIDDYGYMYGRSFEDLDGHLWAPMWMDVDAATQAMAAQDGVTA